MPIPTIPNGAAYMAATTYTGNGSTQAIANTTAGQSFQPDFVWLKTRSTVQNHSLIDSVRGNTKILYSDLTNAEGTFSGVLDSFNSNGFTLGSSASVNQNGTTFVGWQWKAGGTSVTNTAGSISAQVSANTTSGFSVVTYTGTGANATVGHGLGVAPSFIVTKRRNSTGEWYSYHISLGTSFTVILNGTNAQISTANSYLSTSSTTYGIGTNGDMNTSGGTYVSYCWAPIAGFSKFGSYTGNGSADGPFVYTGFRPRFLIIKRTDSTGYWYTTDSARDTYNPESLWLLPNGSNAETSFVQEDFLSNGFKIRNSNADWNASGGTYIYMAFAENPFKYALAR